MVEMKLVEQTINKQQQECDKNNEIENLKVTLKRTHGEMELEDMDELDD